MKTIINIAFVVGCLTCSVSESAPTVATATLDGQIFVVTKGQQAIKLALVSVVAVSEKDLISTVATKAKSIIAQRKELADTIERKKAEVISFKAAAKYSDGSEGSPFAELERLSAICKPTADVDAFLRCAKTPEGKRSLDRMKELRQQNKEEMEPVTAVLSELRPLMKEHRTATTNLRLILTTENLTASSIARTKTDADGKFSLSLPMGQRVAILADSSRAVLDNKEAYQWIVWFTPKKGTKNSLVLANDNLIETNCDTCAQLLDTADMRTYPDISGPPERIVAR